MEIEALVVAQLVRLFRERSSVVWELVEASHPPRRGDIPLRDIHGQVVAYARPAGNEIECPRVAMRAQAS